MAPTQTLVHGWSKEQGFRCCFENGVKESLVSSVAQATDGRFLNLFIIHFSHAHATSELLKQGLISPGGRFNSAGSFILIINIISTFL